MLLLSAKIDDFFKQHIFPFALLVFAAEILFGRAAVEMAILVIPDLGQFFQYILIEFNRRVSTLGVESLSGKSLTPTGFIIDITFFGSGTPKNVN